LEEVHVTRIEPFLPPQDEQSASARRVDAANQRDNWLRQMELAQMGQMGATPGPTAPAPRPAMTSLAQAPMHAAQHPAAREDSAGASDAPDDAGAEAAHDDGAASAEPRTQAGDDARMTEDDGADAASIAAAATALAAAQPAAVAAAEPANVPAGAAGGIALAMAPGALRGVADGSMPLAAQPQAVGLAAALRAPQAMPAESNAAAETAEAPSSGADAAGEAPDWQKRMMHLTGDGDDVQLWIRDGELSPAQSQQLVARLAADVAAMGLRLKEATVNGKPALRAAVRDVDDSADSPLPITHPTTER
jgi:hypothetical protein